MIRFALVTMLFVASAAEARQKPEEAPRTSGFVESWNVLSETGLKPQFNVSVNVPIEETGKVHFTVWTLTQKTWSEAMLGFNSSLIQEKDDEGNLVNALDFSVSGGLEHAAAGESSLRVGWGVFGKLGRLSVLSLREEGVAHWYRHLVTYQLPNGITVGAQSLRFFGNGPYIAKSIGKNYTAWFSYAIDEEKALVTINRAFK